MQKPDDELVMDLEAIQKRESRRAGWALARDILIAAIAAGTLGAFGWGLWETHKPKTGGGTNGTVWASGAYVYSETPAPPRPVSDKALNKALDDALALWGQALGTTPRRPPLVVGQVGDCAGDMGQLIACADVKAYKIIIRQIYYADPKTVMMHELGHLLGVPHIDGDALMGSVYGGAVEKPTRQAIALAKDAARP